MTCFAYGSKYVDFVGNEFSGRCERPYEFEYPKQECLAILR